MHIETEKTRIPRETVSIDRLPGKYMGEIADIIRKDTLDAVNQTAAEPVIPENFYTRYGKRGIDIAVSLLALAVTAPVNLVIGAVTYFDVGRPILFKQKRVGKDRKLFYIYKFRNMTNARDKEGNLLHPSLRVTKWGKFVRKTSLDELLNFVSILKGDMTLIGPRPLLPEYMDRLHRRHLGMYAVRPGLECPFHEDLDHPATWQDRLDNYAWYAEHVSFLTDVKLAFRLVRMVFSKESTSVRASAVSGGFLGYDAEGNVIHSRAVPVKYVEAFLASHPDDGLENLIQNKS